MNQIIIYDKICIMCPTYGRAESKLPKFISSLMETADDLEKICLSFVVNESDTASKRIIKSLCDKNVEYEIILEDTEECDLSYYFNLSYKATKFNDPATCVSMFGDDMVFITKGWDTIMLKKINDIFGLGIIYGDDDNSQHEELCVYFITTRAFVELTEKSFMCKLFTVDYIDNVWMEVGRKLHCAVYLPNLHIFHDHATRNGRPDEVWLRMRKNYDLSHRCMITIDDYSMEIAENVRKNIAEKYLSDDLSYCMTTYGRVVLFRQTVNSWNKSLLLPNKLFVFDDGSEEIDKIRMIIQKMKNAFLVPAEKHSGCDKRNALAITYFNTPAVMVIDSDTAFAPHWCIAANSMWEAIKDSPDIAGATIFNTQYHKTIDTNFIIPGLDVKETVGGFGTIFKREVIEEAFKGKDIEKMPVTWSWDNCINDLVRTKKMQYCSTKKSYLQHTGFVEGTHISDGELSDYAPEFVGKVEYNRPIRTIPLPTGSNVLFAALARLGDIIAASMIANMIVENGMELTWLVIPIYEMLIIKICPWAKVKPIEPLVGGPKGEWSETSIQKMREKFGNFSTYINVQLGARENHNFYLMSGKHPCVWIRDMCNQALGLTLGNDFKSYLRFNERLVPMPSRGITIPGNLAIISPEARTSQCFNETMIDGIYNDLKDRGYTPKILIEKRPQRTSIRDIREKYIFGLTIEQCIILIKKAKHFVGQDSGLSWCSLYSDCTKEIYHRRSRIDRTNTYFNMIDDKAKDIILEEK